MVDPNPDAEVRPETVGGAGRPPFHGRLIALFDTSIASPNIGDQIIMDSVRRQLGPLFPGAYFVNLPTHDIISKISRRLVERSDYSFVGGTNLLSSDMDRHNQWKIGRPDAKQLSDILLLGVGWWKYQDAANRYTRKLLKAVLHPTLLHSVRDSYTQRKLAEAGIENVVNTACVTMWGLTPTHCAQIPREKGDAVVATLTDYSRDHVHDAALLDALRRNYSKVYLWLQGVGDFEYAHSLDLPAGVELVDPSLVAYDELLASRLALDYVGTRLHAGIRAMEHKRRTLILAVDNRASEIGRDFNLPVIDRMRTDLLDDRLTSPGPTELSLPLDKIEMWKAQFAKLS